MNIPKEIIEELRNTKLASISKDEVIEINGLQCKKTTIKIIVHYFSKESFIIKSKPYACIFSDSRFYTSSFTSLLIKAIDTGDWSRLQYIPKFHYDQLDFWKHIETHGNRKTNKSRLPADMTKFRYNEQVEKNTELRIYLAYELDSIIYNQDKIDRYDKMIPKYFWVYPWGTLSKGRKDGLYFSLFKGVWINSYTTYKLNELPELEGQKLKSLISMMVRILNHLNFFHLEDKDIENMRQFIKSH